MQQVDRANQEFTRAITKNITRRLEDLTIGSWSGEFAIVVGYAVASFALPQTPLQESVVVVCLGSLAIVLGGVWILKASLQEIADATATLDITAVKALAERTSHLSEESKDIIRAGWVSTTLAYPSAIGAKNADYPRVFSKLFVRAIILVVPPTLGWFWSN